MTASPGRPLLTIGYSTVGPRLYDLILPKDRPGVTVMVCAQGDPQGESLAAEGMTLVRVPGRGVARSRNAAIDHAVGRYLLFCDDDVLVNVDGVMRGVRYLQATGRAIALGRGVDPAGVARKAYPVAISHLTLFNSAKAATYEMLIDVDQVRSRGLRFDVRFGAGAPLRLGDEYIFIADLLRAGLTGSAVPWVFGIHPTDSSGSRWGTEDDTHERAVVLNRVFGRMAPLARAAFALSNYRKFRSTRLVLSFVLNGHQPPREDGAAGRTPAAAG